MKNITKSHITAGLVAAGLAFAGTSAAAQEKITALDWAKLQAADYSRAGKPVDYALKNLKGIFRRYDVDGGGISDSDRKLTAQMNTASYRSSIVSRYLRIDLNGDGKVDMDEIMIEVGKRARRPIYVSGIYMDPTEEIVKSISAKLAGKVLKIDTNGDKTISFDEMLADAVTQTEARLKRFPRANISEVPVLLDEDGDGTVSKKEFEAIMTKAMAWVDTDGDGKVSSAEHAAARAARNVLYARIRAAFRKKPAQ